MPVQVLANVPSEHLVRDAHQLGVRDFMVSTDMHWPVYEATANGIAELLGSGEAARESIKVYLISYMTRAEFCHEPFRERIQSIRGLAYADVTIMGACDVSDFVSRLEAFRTHCSDPSIRARAIGINTGSVPLLKFVLREGLADVVLVPISPRRRDLADVLSEAKVKSGAQILALKPEAAFVSRNRMREVGLSDEDPAPSADDYVQYALATPNVTGVVLGCQTGSCLRSHAGEMVKHSPSEFRTYLEELSDLDQGLAELEQTKR